jgi:hypothetical protein
LITLQARDGRQRRCGDDSFDCYSPTWDSGYGNGDFICKFLVDGDNPLNDMSQGAGLDCAARWRSTSNVRGVDGRGSDVHFTAP